MSDLYLVEVFPVEILNIIWAMLPLRTQATATKVDVVANYARLLDGIPDLDKYVRYLIRNSHDTAFLFTLVLEHRAVHWARLGRWRALVGPDTRSFTDYLSYLAWFAREQRKPKCSLALSEVRERYEATKILPTRKKTNGCKNNGRNSRKQWEV